MDFNGEDQGNAGQGKSKRDLIWERKKMLIEQRLLQSDNTKKLKIVKLGGESKLIFTRKI